MFYLVFTLFITSYVVNRNGSLKFNQCFKNLHKVLKTLITLLKILEIDSNVFQFQRLNKYLKVSLSMPELENIKGVL